VPSSPPPPYEVKGGNSRRVAQSGFFSIRRPPLLSISFIHRIIYLSLSPVEWESVLVLSLIIKRIFISLKQVFMPCLAYSNSIAPDEAYMKEKYDLNFKFATETSGLKSNENKKFVPWKIIFLTNSGFLRQAKPAG
jgi:hypothetical protein